MATQRTLPRRQNHSVSRDLIVLPGRWHSGGGGGGGGTVDDFKHDLHLAE